VPSIYAELADEHATRVGRKRELSFTARQRKTGLAQHFRGRASAVESRLLNGQRQVLAYSVEKLISCALPILQMKRSVAENQASTRTLAYMEQLRAEIVGSRWSFGSFKLRPF
jgi:hypothetical protein